MKARYVVLTCLLSLLIFPVAHSQSKPAFEKKADIILEDANDRIVAQKFLSDDRLLLVSKQKVQVFDRVHSKLLESRPIATADFCEDKDRVISPNGRWMLVFGNYGCAGKKDKIKRPAAVWDLETGKQIAVLDKLSQPLGQALWSSNGKTLVTSSDFYKMHFSDPNSVEIAFWDGQTFAFKNSLPSGKVNWFQITSDGDRCLYLVAPVKSRLLFFKYFSGTGGPIGVWNISRGQIEQTISLDGNAAAKLSAVNLSPDETLITFLAQPAKSKDIQRKLLAWKLDENNTHKYEMKYEIRAASKTLKRGAMFSPDSKYLAVMSNRNLRIYDSNSGQQKSEMAGDHYPTAWLDDNRILLFVNADKMEARETATGKLLYEDKVIYNIAEYPGDNETPNYFTVDQTEVVVHPTMNLFLTYSERFIKIYDSRTGEILQTVVSPPPIDHSKKKPNLSYKEIVSKAGWSNDGLTLYFVSYDKRSISLWRLIE